MIKLLSKRQLTIGSAAALLGFFTILAQLLAVVKNKLLSVHFGASTDLDIFYAAFKIPDIIFLVVGGLAVSSILIPIFTEKENISIEEKEKFMSKFFNSFSFILIIISILTFFSLEWLLPKIFSYQAKDAELLLSISKLFILSPIFMGLGNFFISINQRNKIFLPMALTGLFYNISIILSIIFLSPIFGIKGVAYGIIFGALIFLLIQLPTIFKHHLFKLGFNFLSFQELKKVFGVAIPRSFALSFSSLILLFIYAELTNLNSPGLITIFSFAYALFWLPIALINGSYSQAMLPTISKFYSQKKMKQFENVLREVYSRIFFLIIPISFFTFSFSGWLVATLFGSQKFNLIFIDETAKILTLFALMIPFMVLLLVNSRIFYSMGKTKEVFWANFLALIILSIFVFGNKMFNFSFDNFEKLLFLTSSFLISYFFASIFIFLKLKKQIEGVRVFNFSRLKKKIFIAFLSVLMTKLIILIFHWNYSLNFLGNILFLILIILIFSFFEILFSEILKEENYIEFKEKIFNRIDIGRR